MVTIPAGEFLMGSTDSEEDGGGHESPQHPVSISQPFALGKFEVTFAEWDACVAGGGCSHQPRDSDWGRGTRPVINVSWNDAQMYVRWLSQKTGHVYRLPSEAEWEYAARAGSEAARYWGASIGYGLANCFGCGGQWDAKLRSTSHWPQTAPVGSFPANAFGLHDMLGNVWEWVEDCYHYSYRGAPTDGSAWKGGDCDRVLRGGSYTSKPGEVRSAARHGDEPSNWYRYYGFRVMRTASE
jgi:formylglycine-generating enzyme required for sulfatase activity